MSHAKFESMLQKAIDTRMNEISRRRLFRNAAIAGGSMAVIGSVGFASAQDATPVDGAAEEAPFADGAEVANYALTLEHLETAFYRDGLAELGVDGFTALGFQANVFDRLSEIGAHEAEHVVALIGVVESLGGTPVEEATYDFGYTDAEGFLQVAQALEDTGVSAYQGAAQYLIEAPDILTAALTIHGVEARHAAYIALLNGAVPFPEAVNPTLTPAEVLEIATPLIVS